MIDSLPKYFELMLPLLEAIADGKSHALKDLELPLGAKLGLSDEQLSLKYEREGSVSKNIFFHRIGWARSYLRKAGLVEIVSPGVIKITDIGKALLNNPPDVITPKFLQANYPEFEIKRKTSNSGGVRRTVHQKASEVSDDMTPEEKLNEVSRELHTEIENELMRRLLEMTPRQFEVLVVELLEKMGYGVGEVTRYSKDGGIDGMVRGDFLGFEMIYIQAKRWQNPVGRREVSQFIGDILHRNAKKGLFITTSTFLADAHTVANVQQVQIQLIDGEQLVKYMIKLGLGVTVAATYNVYKIDTDFFVEG